MAALRRLHEFTEDVNVWIELSDSVLGVFNHNRTICVFSGTCERLHTIPFPFPTSHVPFQVITEQNMSN